jgi:uncharacterized lipoprotein YddW (UPF0748 family)
VNNIDWPSKRNLSTEQQQKELIAILDRTKALNLNAVVFQIRPAMDALYKSDIEPWSLYLTGESGKAPEPFYDPLEFLVTEGHKRGIQIHTWLNPYRAHFVSASTTESLAENHVVRAKPQFVRRYGTFYWVDPTDAEALAHNVSVFKDVVKRYDVDGIHMDDYFYPYVQQDPVSKKDIPFPDDANWNAYKQSGGELSRGDWRRSKVNELVQTLGKAIKEVRSTVQYGISPFGIWRPGFPKGVEGLDQYDVLYADAKLWLNEGWVDYFTPQLYWKIQQQERSYPDLLRWWMSENTKNRHIWPGLYTGRKEFRADEIVNQVVLTRFLGATGNIHFSYKAFETNYLGISDQVTTKGGVYASPALPPTTPWLDAIAPPAPTQLTAVKLDKPSSASIGLSWKPAGDPASNPEDKVFVWAIYKRQGGRWIFDVQPAHVTTLTLSPDDKGDMATTVAVAATDRLGNISSWVVVETGKAEAADGETKEKFGQVQ